MHHESLLAAFLVAAATLSGVLWFPDIVGYLAVLGAIVTLVVYALVASEGCLPVRAHPAVTLPLLVVWITLIVTALLHPDLGALKRAPAFILGSAAFALVVPATLSRVAIERAVAVVTTGMILVSLPGVLTGRYWIGPLFFDVGALLVDLPYVDGAFAAKAIFPSPNYVALLSVFSLLGSVRHLSLNNTHSQQTGRWTQRTWAIFAILSLFGLLLTLGRAALLALTVCVAFALIYHIAGWRGFAVGIVCLMIVVMAGILVVIFLPALWQSVGPSLTGRATLWRTAAELIGEHPMTGWGLIGPQELFAARIPSDAMSGNEVADSIHNSYIRLFFLGGALSGFAYLGLVGGVLWVVVGRVRADGTVWPVLPAIAVLVLHVFNGSTIFGLSLQSMLAAVFVGYAQPVTAERTLDIQMSVRHWLRRCRSSLPIDN